ncbi:YbdD/YjiX family protein [Kocuria coralli]|uniref:YbdD/YjiX family protein n=1 Tax=Kocuria coralli TaxID=1461025 RepID=A0A5J5KV72_9MICC|nr:YbdD/YjiX family protein [Kocuria coralli]KAA9393474.1 YbdD/YjiX family protein [Kocuria coralli]
MTTLRAAAAAVGRNLGGARRWFSGVMGADKYERYLEYHAAHGDPGETPMTEREFWRDWQDYQQNNPQGRCC